MVSHFNLQSLRCLTLRFLQLSALLGLCLMPAWSVFPLLHCWKSIFWSVGCNLTRLTDLDSGCGWIIGLCNDSSPGPFPCNLHSDSDRVICLKLFFFSDSEKDKDLPILCLDVELEWSPNRDFSFVFCLLGRVRNPDIPQNPFILFTMNCHKCSLWQPCINWA